MLRLPYLCIAVRKSARKYIMYCPVCISFNFYGTCHIPWFWYLYQRQHQSPTAGRRHASPAAMWSRCSLAAQKKNTTKCVCLCVCVGGGGGIWHLSVRLVLGFYAAGSAAAAHLPVCTWVFRFIRHLINCIHWGAICLEI